MKKYEFKSCFADRMTAFLRHKRALGLIYSTEEEYLVRFDKLCISENVTEPVLTKELAEKFAERNGGESAKSRYNRVCATRQFAEYLNKGGEVAYVLPEEKKPFCKQGYAPYIFTDVEVKQLIEAAEQYEYSRTRTFFKTMLPVAFRILYGCGLRKSEVSKLRHKDFDEKNGILTILDSKNAKDRLIPLSGQLSDRLKDYCLRIHEICPDTEWLFPQYGGKQLSETWLYVWFRKLLVAAGITHHGKGRGPRLHDLRHTFAVHSMRQMENDGLDLYTVLPILSAYLGHSNISATEQYLRLTTQVYGDILAKSEKAFGQIVLPVLKERI